MATLFDNPDGVAKPRSNYSQVARVPLGGATLLFVSGQGPEDATGATVGVGDAAAQAAQVFANICTCLTAHGATMRDVVKLTVYLTDMTQRHHVAAARERFFPDTAPTSTAAEITRLAVDDWIIEIDAVAVLVP